MSKLRHVAWLTAMMLVAVPLVALSDMGMDDVPTNSERLEKWRQDPKEFARLRTAAEKFAALPQDRREQILKLHRQLEQSTSSTQTQLLHALERYVDWLAELDPETRKKVEQTRDKGKRLQLIRELRDKEWLKQQPYALRTQVEKLPGNARQKRIEEVRAAERQRRRDWAIAARFWEDLSRGKQTLPMQLSDFSAEVQKHVVENLLPRLNAAEKARLQQAEGNWPRYPQVLIELADAHPIALPDPAGPRYYKELPGEVQRRLKLRLMLTVPKTLETAEGKSSVEFIKAVVNHAHKRANVQLPAGFWPTDYQGLLPEMRQFVDSTLLPVLDIDEKIRYNHAEGNWPDYPLTIEELARKHALRPPWPNLPGPAQQWDKYR